MKIAVCLSGHMRTYQEVIHSQIKELFAPNQCDVFIATWDRIGVRRTEARGIHPIELDDPIDLNAIKSAYHPYLKDIRVFNYEVVTPTIPLPFYPGFSYMFWLIKESHVLMSEYESINGFQYDIVIRGRPDLKITKGFSMTSPLPDNKILVPHFNDIIMSDVFACGSRKAMEIYASTHFHLPTYAKRVWPKIPNTTCDGGWPEQILLTHLNEQGIKLEMIPFEGDIVRIGYPFLA